MQQYFVQGSFNINDTIVFNEEQSHHMLHVLRMREQELIRVVDERGQVFLAQVKRNDDTLAQAIIKEELPPSAPVVHITLALALIKGERWDYAIQKACELGVSQIQPIVCERCVVKVKEDGLEKKLRRWNKIALEACEQCKRSDLVEVNPPLLLRELAKENAQLKLVAYENADHKADALRHIVSEHPDVEEILVVIGPEGGFTQAEFNFLVEQGFCCMSLGPRILRAETAALAAVNSLMVYYEK